MVLLTVGLQAFLHDPVQDLQWLSMEAYKVDFAEESARAVSQQPVALYALPGANEAVSQSAADLSGNTKQLPRRARRTILAYYKKNFSGQSIDKAGQQQSDVDLMEIYSPPRVTARARGFGLKHGGALDLATGWEFYFGQPQRCSTSVGQRAQAALIILSPPCRTFSSLRYLSDHKRSRDVVEREQKEGLEHLRRAPGGAHGVRGSFFKSSWICVFLDWSPKTRCQPSSPYATHQHRDSCYPLRSSMWRTTSSASTSDRWPSSCCGDLHRPVRGQHPAGFAAASSTSTRRTPSTGLLVIQWDSIGSPSCSP